MPAKFFIEPIKINIKERNLLARLVLLNKFFFVFVSILLFLGIAIYYKNYIFVEYKKNTPNTISMFENPTYFIPPRNLKFIDRNEIFDEVQNYFAKHNKGMSMQVIAGVGGIGKTQIVKEYAYRAILSKLYDVFYG